MIVSLTLRFPLRYMHLQAHNAYYMRDKFMLIGKHFNEKHIYDKSTNMWHLLCSLFTMLFQKTTVDSYP